MLYGLQLALFTWEVRASREGSGEATLIYIYVYKISRGKSWLNKFATNYVTIYVILINVSHIVSYVVFDKISFKVY